jgi:hypothetical protein
MSNKFNNGAHGKQGTNRRLSAAKWYKVANMLNNECNKLRVENAELKAKLTPVIVAEEGVVAEQ